MGANSSKPDQSHVWKANGPVGVSHDVVESLQASSESDTTRSQNLELAVQARVASELKKLREQQGAAVRAALEQASEYADEEEQRGRERSRPRVSKEVDALRARLEKRKQLRVLPDSVEAAREGVVRCLTENDRRPLDCWREVEAFKEEVRKLEKEWVERVVR